MIVEADDIEGDLLPADSKTLQRSVNEKRKFASKESLLTAIKSLTAPKKTLGRRHAFLKELRKGQHRAVFKKKLEEAKAALATTPRMILLKQLLPGCRKKKGSSKTSPASVSEKTSKKKMSALKKRKKNLKKQAKKKAAKSLSIRAAVKKARERSV
jgi:hypothetical protein